MITEPELNHVLRFHNTEIKKINERLNEIEHNKKWNNIITTDIILIVCGVIIGYYLIH